MGIDFVLFNFFNLFGFGYQYFFMIMDLVMFDFLMDMGMGIIFLILMSDDMLGVEDVFGNCFQQRLYNLMLEFQMN